jgi:hypothetical protein
MRIIVVGGRDILLKHYEYIKSELDNVITKLKSEGHSNFEIVHGELTYCEKMAKTYAEEKGYKHKKFVANIRNLDVKTCRIEPDRYGRPYNALANVYKNEKEFNYAKEDNGILVAFYNGKSKGTKGFIKQSKKHNLRTIIIDYKNNI